MVSNASFSQVTKTGAGSYRVQNWTTGEGLPNNFMNWMIKDSLGFLWIGSMGGGLSKFDGARFKEYMPGTDAGQINNNQANGFAEDGASNIWIGTLKGVSRYDLRADTFTNLETEVDSIGAEMSMIPIQFYGDEMFCIESWSRKIVAYNIHSFNKRIFFSPTPANKPLTTGLRLKTTWIDFNNQQVWMIEENESRRSAYLIQIDLRTGKKTDYSWECPDVKRAHRHSAEAMRHDSRRNSFWLNSGDGLLEFSLRDKQFRRVNGMEKWMKSGMYDRYVGVDLDPMGRVWFSTNPEGILIYNPEKEDIHPVLSDPSIQQQAGVHNMEIYCDRDGHAWASDYYGAGIFQLIPYQPVVNQYSSDASRSQWLSSNQVLNITRGEGENMWLGTMDGINIFDPVSETFTVLRSKDVTGIHEQIMIPVHVDSTLGKAWIVTLTMDSKTKLFEMDLVSKQCRPVLFRDSLQDRILSGIEYTLTIADTHHLLIANDFNGIYELKKGSYYAERIIDYRGGIGRMIKGHNLLFLHTGGNTPGKTYKKTGGKWKEFPHVTDSIAWFNLFYDRSDSTYWLSTRNELIRYDHHFNKMRTFGSQDGFDGYVQNYQTDKAGNIWFTDNVSRIARIDKKTGVISQLPEAGGLIKTKFTWFSPGGMSANGEIYFSQGESSKSTGMVRIKPQFFSVIQPSKVYFTDVRINYSSLHSHQSYDYIEALDLNYKENNIGIETGILDHNAKGGGRIRYRLETDGVAGEWQVVPAYSSIRYEGLPPGHYRVIMQSTNLAGEFNSREKVLSIVIHPPFWQTWWFRILITFLLAGAVYAYVQYRSRKLRERNAELEHKVEQRTNELKASLKELKETQNMLIQNEKMASLGELTAGIAHEIQNPLNFVNNFSEVNSELFEEVKEEKEKGNEELASSLLDDIRENNDKISLYGKRAGLIVKGMLEHTRISKGQKEPTDINMLCEEYLRIAYHGYKAKENSNEVQIDIDTDPTIGELNIIPQDIGRVLVNLLNNAFYAVNEKKTKTPGDYIPQITLTTIHQVENIAIRISDNGPGIAKKIIDKIFQPFFTTKPTGQGTGLGLSLSYDIIKAHGGELKVESKEGEGTEFIIQLPVA